MVECLCSCCRRTFLFADKGVMSLEFSRCMMRKRCKWEGEGSVRLTAFPWFNPFAPRNCYCALSTASQLRVTLGCGRGVYSNVI